MVFVATAQRQCIATDLRLFMVSCEWKHYQKQQVLLATPEVKQVLRPVQS